MSQKSSVPQAVSFVSQVLKRDMSTLVNISNRPSPFLSREQRLQSQHRVLTKLYEDLEPFDSQLAEVYLRDSGPSSAN